MSAAGVIRAQDHAMPGNLQPRKYGSRDLPGVHVSGVGSHAPDRVYFFLRWREIRLDISAQAFGICRIETPRNSRFTDSRTHTDLTQPWNVSRHSVREIYWRSLRARLPLLAPRVLLSLWPGPDRGFQTGSALSNCSIVSCASGQKKASGTR